MSTFTERGASSSSINLMNSSTRYPEGEAMQKPRTGNDWSAAGRFNVPTSSRHSPLFTRITFGIRLNISAVWQISLQAQPSGSTDQFCAARVGMFLWVFRLYNVAHEFRRELGVLVSEFDPDCFTIHDGQLVAKLVADAALSACGPNPSAAIPSRL